VQVSRLKRIRYGSVELPRELRRGHWRVLPPETYRALRTAAGLTEAPQTLTLQPVIGVRRAAKAGNEFKPVGRARSSFDVHGSDEARELRAFDVVREDRPASRPGGKRRFGKKPGGAGAAGAGARRGRGAGGSWQDGNAGGARTWTPGGALTAPGGEGPQRNKRRRGGKPGRPGAGATPFGFPSDHAYARRDASGGPARGPRDPNAGPGRGPRGPNAGPGRGPNPGGSRGGPRGNAGGPARGNAGGPARGNAGPGRPDGGNRPPRRGKPGGRGRPRPT
jgi:23S rRNA pseudouridine2605 synthase